MTFSFARLKMNNVPRCSSGARGTIGYNSVYAFLTGDLACVYLLGHEEEIILTFFTLMVLDPPAAPLVAPELAAPAAPAPDSPVIRTW
jgi:hypothetical protein